MKSYGQFRHLMFDLDNTLYPESCAMDAGISQRMKQTVADFLNIPLKEAVKLRMQRMPFYGTTLDWLRSEHGLTDTEWFFRKVHPESEVNELVFDAKLRPFLQSLDMPMSVLTNAPLEHALRVLNFFKINDLFIHVCDIKENNFKGKPAKSAFCHASETAGFSISETLFIDDHPKYTRGYAQIGGTPLLVDEKNKHQDEQGLRVQSIYELPEILKTF